MSQPNVELVQRWIDTFADDPEGFRETLHPDLEWFPFEENHTPSHGPEGGMRIRNEWAGTWDELGAEIEDVVHRDEHVVASIHATGRGKASGVEVDVRLYLHFKVRDGRIVYVFEHLDRAEALEAAGLSE